jgi:hypothetical protein
MTSTLFIIFILYRKISLGINGMSIFMTQLHFFVMSPIFIWLFVVLYKQQGINGPNNNNHSVKVILYIVQYRVKYKNSSN